MMAFTLKTAVSAEELKGLSPAAIASIEKSINESLDSKLEAIEADNARKFEELIDNITDKYEKQVNAVVLESAKANTSNLINTKLYGIVKDIANLLEGAGITTTEKTKELQQKLKKTDQQLETVYKDREEIKEQLDDEMKKNLIYAKLHGMKPEVVDLAIETFKNKDIREIDDDAIAAFLDGDFTDLVADSVENDQFSGDIELDQVRDALAEIDETKSSTPIKSNKVFESLGKGLKHQRAASTPDVSYDDLTNSAITEAVGDGFDSETMETMGKIEEFRDFGYNFS